LAFFDRGFSIEEARKPSPMNAHCEMSIDDFRLPDEGPHLSFRSRMRERNLLLLFFTAKADSSSLRFSE
jgi:hypothetical protein